MGKDTVEANGKPVATKGTDHVAAQTKPDKLLIKGKPTPFFNYAKTQKALVSAATKTLYAGQPIWTAPGELTPSEEVPAAPSGPGETSGTYIGRAVAPEWSLAVFVEVAGGVRLDDKTTQNNGNTVGKVIRAADLDGLIKKFLEETAAAALPPAGTGPAPGTGPDDGRKPDGDGQTLHFTETVTVTATPDPEEECVLVDATMTRGSRSASKAEGLLEIVPKHTVGKVNLKATVQKPCGPDHPLWHIGGFWTSERKGAEVWFPAVNWGTTATSLEDMITARPHAYEISVEAHKKSKKFRLNAYPQESVSYGIELDWLKSATEKFTAPLNAALEGVLEIKFKLLVGSGSYGAGWKEHTDHRAYCEFAIAAAFSPLFGCDVKIFIKLPGPLLAVQMFLDKVLKKIGGGFNAFVKISFGCSLSGKLSQKIPIEMSWEGSGEVEGKGGVGLGIEVSVRKDILSCECNIGLEAGVNGEVSKEGKNLMLKPTFFFGKLKGSVGITVALGKIPWTDLKLEASFNKEVTVWNGITFEAGPWKLWPRH